MLGAIETRQRLPLDEGNVQKRLNRAESRRNRSSRSRPTAPAMLKAARRAPLMRNIIIKKVEGGGGLGLGLAVGLASRDATRRPTHHVCARSTCVQQFSPTRGGDLGMGAEWSNQVPKEGWCWTTNAENR